MIIMTENGMFDVPPSAFFTQAELQQLKVILSEKIEEQEESRSICVKYARLYKRVGAKEGADLEYKDAKKISKRIATLAKLQYKVKHKLLTAS